MVNSCLAAGRSCVAAIVLCMMMAPLASHAGQNGYGSITNEEIIEAVGNALDYFFGEGNGNGNGNGNNADDTQSSDLSEEDGDDGNNGHSNDVDGNDSSNPGNGGNNSNNNPSPSDLLGVETENAGNGTTNATVNPGSETNVTDPEVETEDPFADVIDQTNDSNNAEEEIQSLTAVPYGSVPLIGDDEESVDYLLEKMVSDAQSAAGEAGETPAGAPVLRKAYADYAKDLAKTLGKLTPAQQNFIFYGVE